MISKRTDWYTVSETDVLKKLGVSDDGLTDSEVSERRQQFGRNEIPEQGLRHWTGILFKQFKSLLVAVLMAAALISAATGHVIDMFVIFAVILVNGLIGFVQEMRAERAVASLRTMIVAKAKVLRNGQKTTIPAAELVPGDIIVLQEGDSIPADARLIESRNLRAIEAPLTGESVPVEKKLAQLPAATPLADRHNMVFKGTFIAGGYAEAVVIGTALDTALGDIARTLSDIKVSRTNFQKKTDILARQMAVIAALSAVTLFSVAYFVQGADAGETLIIAIAALVSAIPEGLPAVLAIVLAIGASRMAKHNAIIREFTATETLGAVTTIITDKTGTLTQNTLTVQRVGIHGQEDWTVSGEGWDHDGAISREGKEWEAVDHSALSQVLRIAAFSNNSDVQRDAEKQAFRLIGDPTEGALLVLARKGGLFPRKENDIGKVDDLPFSSELKLRATLTDDGRARQLLVVGAPEQVLEQCTSVLTADGAVPMSDGDADVLQKKIEAWSSKAMRVIALAYRDEEATVGSIDPKDVKRLTFAGIVGMIDPPRPDVREAVLQCRSAGIRVIMATGDHVRTAIAIAQATAIISGDEDPDSVALTEKQLLELTDAEFGDAVRRARVFARLTPNMKLRIAEVLQQQGELIAMTGDGVNDAPALKKADVGVAMGIMGTDVARDSAQVVLADDNFSTIVKAVEEGRIVFNNTRHTSFFLLTTNFAEIVTLVSAVAMGMPVPLTATQILWLNLVTDGTCTTAMATESGHGDELQAKPVNPEERILTAEVLPFLMINAALMAVLALGAFNWFLPEGVQKARSAAFIIMAFSQLFNVFNMRALRLSAFSIGFFTNRWVNLALVVSVVLMVLIIEVPFFERLFHFDPVSFSEFTVLALLSSLVLVFGEAYKFVRYKLIQRNKA